MSEFSFRQSKALEVIFGLFLIFLVWRLGLYFMPAPPEESFNLISFVWGASYQIIALLGAIIGLKISRSWGGWSSVLGRAMIAFSIGLILQCVGQSFSSYFVYFTGEVPYPSFGDIGFFGSVIFYIYGVITLARLAGVQITAKSFAKKLLAIIIPIAGLIVSYLIFLKGYPLDWEQPLSVFLNIGYPIGQAFYVSIALLIFLFSKDVLGGIMRWPIMFFLIALIAQYVSDFTFLYQATRGSYIPEGVNDLMYFASYFLMAVSLLRLGTVFEKIKNS